jgi:Putative phage metallopeptidase
MPRGRSADSKVWRAAPDAKRIVDHLIATLVDKETGELVHGHLATANIMCLAKPKASVSGGKVNVAKIRVASARDKALWLMAGGEGGLHYTIEVGADAWDLADEHIREIVMDHELCHANEPDEDDRGRLTPHDVQEFSSIIKRYGTDYDRDVQAFVRAARERKQVE